MILPFLVAMIIANSIYSMHICPHNEMYKMIQKKQSIDVLH